MAAFNTARHTTSTRRSPTWHRLTLRLCAVVQVNDFDTQVLAVIRGRDQYNAQIQKLLAEHAHRTEVLGKLGYGQPIAGLPYASGGLAYGLGGGGGYGGYAGPYSLSGSAYTFPVSATSAYGYTYNSVVPPPADVTQLFQMAAQLSAAQIKASGDGYALFGQSIDKVAAGNLEIARIVTKHQAMAEIAKVIYSNPNASGYSFTLSPAGDFKKGDAPADYKAKSLQAWGEHASQTCGACHFGDKKKGNFSIADYQTMSPQEKASRVWPRLFSNDPKTRMPLAADGSPGQPLNDQQKRLWLEN